ncbi:hypothetical protein D3C80_1547320 [compost metagenome]
MGCALVVLVEQVQVGAGAVIDEQRLELLAWHVALEVLVVVEVAGGVLAQVAVDVLRGLLAADAETLHQVPGGQAAFPPGHGFDQAIAQGQIPANACHRLLALHACCSCAKTLPVRVNTLDG